MGKAKMLAVRKARQNVHPHAAESSVCGVADIWWIFSPFQPFVAVGDRARPIVLLFLPVDLATAANPSEGRDSSAGSYARGTLEKQEKGFSCRRRTRSVVSPWKSDAFSPGTSCLLTLKASRSV
jgi:hypothetical protein